MTDLLVDALTWPDANGAPITIGGADAHLYLGERGVEGLGQPPYRMQLTDRTAGGAQGGSSVRGASTISVEAWLDAGDGHSKDYADLWRLYEAMNERPDPFDELPLSWSGLMWPAEHRRYVRPALCDWATDETGVHGGAPGLKLQWVAADPTTYSEAAAGHPFTAAGSLKEITVTNDGTRASRGRRCWTARIDAHGAVSDPFVKLKGTGHIVTWKGLTVPSGGSLVVDDRRRSWVGSRRVDGYIRSGASKFPDWPAIPPGEHVLQLGCRTGTITGRVDHRSSW